MPTGVVIVLADAATFTGLGHWVRSAALAEELAARGRAVHVLHRNDATAAAVTDARARGWQVWQSDWTLPSIRTAGGGERGIAIVDSYRADAELVGMIRAEGWVTVVIDDLADRGALAADVVINQNLGADRTNYRVPRHTDLLLGPDFALLRPQFAHHRAAGLERVAGPVASDDVLVMMGGSDAAGVLDLVVSACLDALPTSRIRAITPARTRLDQIDDPRLNLIPPTPDVAAEMVAADIVISAGGTSVWELCATARPFGIVVVADNQEEATGLLEAAGAARIVGRRPLDVGRLAANVARLASDGEALGRQARTAASIVDGLGCARAAERITRMEANDMQTMSTKEAEK